MPSVNPSNVEEVQHAVRGYLERAEGLAGVAFEAPLTPLGRGFDTHIYAFALSSHQLPGRWAGSLVLRLYRTPDEDDKATRDAAVQRWAADAGYPTPHVLASAASDNPLGLPFMIMARAPGRAMLERIASNPLSARRHLARMARLHVDLHRLPVGACPLPAGLPLIDRRLDVMHMQTTRAQLDSLRHGFERLRRCSGIVRGEDATFCHGDFHPLNIVVDDAGGSVVVDWSDAALGDRHSDVARTVTLLSFAYIAAQSTVERILLRSVKGLLRSWYFRPYDRLFPVDQRRLLYWEAFQAFYALLQLHELDADRPETLGSNPEGVQRFPRTLRDDVWRHFVRKIGRLERVASPLPDEGAADRAEHTAG
jgi:aminoglycoside phosphotransferase (APT) family kinase protein